jgi:hypothetical protein
MQINCIVSLSVVYYQLPCKTLKDLQARAAHTVKQHTFTWYRSKKIYRLKEDQAFSLSLELGRREQVAWHPSADFLLRSLGGGGDFVDTVIAVKMI